MITSLNVPVGHQEPQLGATADISRSFTDSGSVLPTLWFPTTDRKQFYLHLIAVLCPLLVFNRVKVGGIV